MRHNPKIEAAPPIKGRGFVAIHRKFYRLGDQVSEAGIQHGEVRRTKQEALADTAHYPARGDGLQFELIGVEEVSTYWPAPVPFVAGGLFA